MPTLLCYKHYIIHIEMCLKNQIPGSVLDASAASARFSNHGNTALFISRILFRSDDGNQLSISRTLKVFLGSPFEKKNIFFVDQQVFALYLDNFVDNILRLALVVHLLLADLIFDFVDKPGYNT